MLLEAIPLLLHFVRRALHVATTATANAALRARARELRRGLRPLGRRLAV